MKRLAAIFIHAVPFAILIVLFAACTSGPPDSNPLAGQWEYAVGSLEDGPVQATGYRYAPVPDLGHLEKLVPDGRGTLWLQKRFAAPPGFRDKRWSILLGTIIPVDESFLNGEFIGGRGVFPAEGRSFFSDWNRYRRYEIISTLLKEGENRLLVKIYVEYEGSVNGIIAMGERPEIERIFLAQDFIRFHLNLIVAFIMIATALFLLAIIYLQWPRGAANLYLVATCFLFSFYIINFVVTRLPLDIERLISYDLFQKIAYGAPCLSFFFLIRYIHHLLDLGETRVSAAVEYGGTLAPAAAIAFMPTYQLMVLYGKVVLSACAAVTFAYLLFICVRAVVRGNRNAVIFLAGFVPVIGCVVADIVLHVATVKGDVPYLSGFGISSYLVFIALMLANNFVSYYRKFELLSGDLARKIEEQKKVEDELSSEKELLAVTIGSIAEGVVATDRAGRVLILNRVAEELCGITLAEVLGRPIHRELAGRNEEMAALFSEVFDEMQDADRRFEIGLHRVERGPEDRRYVVGSSAPIRDSDQNIVGSVFVLRDVTGDMKLQNEILKVKKLESLGVLAGGIAHDFNNILTAILGNINLAKLMLATQEEPERLMADAEKAVLRAQGLTRQLLTFSKGGAPVKQVASVQEIIRDSTDFVLRGSNVLCTFDFIDGLWPVNVDVGQFSQVIQNLVINADQSMPDGGEIVIRTENVPVLPGAALPLRPGNYVKISVSDTGIGIDPQSLPRIFDPYFTTKKDGSGLGLASSYSIIKKHDGHLEAVSASGRGSTFIIYLPSSGSHVSGVERAATGVTPVSGTVLLMDDDPGVGLTVRKMLEHLGLSVVVTQNGTEAIDLYRRSFDMDKPFDLVILDLTIPGGIGGREVIQELLKLDPGVTAIVSSGYSTDRVMADHAKYGFKGVISKPYRLEELSDTIRRILAGAGRAS
jgi:PAS domain S-box-containing protein